MGLWSSIKKAAKKVGNAIRGAASQVIKTVQMIVNRVIGVFDFIGSLIGIRPKKKLRLKIVILNDESGEPLTSIKEVTPLLEKAKAIFKEEMNVELKPVKESFIVHSERNSPKAALDVSCGAGAWAEDFGEAGNFFTLHTEPGKTGILGYGAPITAIIVRDVDGKKGCSLGPLCQLRNCRS